MAKVDAYLKKVAELDGSDLHLTSGVAPKARIHGKLVALSQSALNPEQLREMCYELLDERRAKIYTERRDLDLAYELSGVARFRVNMSITRVVSRSGTVSSWSHSCGSTGVSRSKTGLPLYCSGSPPSTSINLLSRGP